MPACCNRVHVCVCIKRHGASALAASNSAALELKRVCPVCSYVVTTVMNNFTLGEHKNMNLPGSAVDLPTITEKDEHDIVNFGLPQGVDAIALSFCRRPEDIREWCCIVSACACAVLVSQMHPCCVTGCCVGHARALLGPAGKHIKIIAKVSARFMQRGVEGCSELMRRRIHCRLSTVLSYVSACNTELNSTHSIIVTLCPRKLIFRSISRRDSS